MFTMQSLAIPSTCPTPSPPSGTRALAVWVLVLGLVSLLPPLALITGPVADILGLVALVTRRPGRGMAVVGGIIGTLAWVSTLILILAFLLFQGGDLAAGIIGFESGVTRHEAVGVYVQRSDFATEILQLFEDGTYVQTAIVDNDPVPRTNRNRWRFRPNNGSRGDVELTDAMVAISPNDNQGRADQTWETLARPEWWEPRPGVQPLIGTKSFGRFGGRIGLEQLELVGVGLYFTKVSE